MKTSPAYIDGPTQKTPLSHFVKAFLTVEQLLLLLALGVLLPGAI